MSGWGCVGLAQFTCDTDFTPPVAAVSQHILQLTKPLCVVYLCSALIVTVTYDDHINKKELVEVSEIADGAQFAFPVQTLTQGSCQVSISCKYTEPPTL